jgi:hypothetical protein
MTELWTTAGIEWADRLAALVGDLKQHNPSLWAHVSQERNERFPLRGWASLSRDGTPTEDVAISLDFERVPGGVKYQADIAHGDGLILAETPAQWRAVGNRGDTRPFSQMTSASGSTQAAGVGEDFMIGVTVARLKGDLPHGPAAFLNEDLVDALAEIGDPKSVDCLRDALRWDPPWDEFGQLARKAVWALGAIGTPEAMAVVREAAGDAREKPREAAIHELRRAQG